MHEVIDPWKKAHEPLLEKHEVCSKDQNSPQASDGEKRLSFYSFYFILVRPIITKSAA